MLNNVGSTGAALGSLLYVQAGFEVVEFPYVVYVLIVIAQSFAGQRVRPPHILTWIGIVI